MEGNPEEPEGGTQREDGPGQDSAVPHIIAPTLKAKRLRIMLGPLDTDGDTARAERKRQDRRWIIDARDRLQWTLRDLNRQASAGAGLLQLIPGTAVEDFRQFFRPSINAEQFHEMLRSVLLDAGKDPAGLRALASALFDSIDTNGSGWVTWEEFSSFLVFQYGESASLHLRRSDIPQYTPLGKPLDRGCIHMSQMRYVPELDRFTMVEASRGTSKRSGVHLATLEEPIRVVTLAEAEGADAAHFLAAEYLPWAEAFACSTTGHNHAALQFYTLQRQELADAKALLVQRWHARESHDLLRADAETGNLFASGRFGHLTVYRVSDIREPTIVPNVTTQEQLHTAAITDLAFLTSLSSKRVASCGLDGLLRVQDAYQLCSHGHHSGPQDLQQHRHPQGLLTIAYSAERNLIFAAGFEREISAWCAIDVKDPLSFKLHSADAPHTERIIHVEVAGPNSVVSTDAAGLIKVWDIRTTGLVQSFHIADIYGEQRYGTAKYTVLSQVLDTKRGTLHAVGRSLAEMSCQLYSFCKLSGGLDDTVAHDGPVGVAVYHAKSSVFLTASSADLKVWDAATGHLQQDFPGFAQSHITALCFDGSGRKFITGTHMGTLTVHSLTTGVATFEYVELPGEVINICYLGTVNHLAVACADQHVRLYDYEGTQPGAVMVIKHSTGFSRLVYCRALAMAAVVDDQESALVYAVRAVRLFDHKFTCCYSKDQTTARFLSRGRSARQSMSPNNRSAARRKQTLAEANAAAAATDLPAHAAETDAALRDYFGAKRSDLTAGAFAPPYAALVLGDTAGFLTAWQLWGDDSNRPVLRWRIPSPGAQPVSPWAMDWLEGRGCLCVGDELGRVGLWDVGPRLGQLQVPLVSAVELHDGAPDGNPLVRAGATDKARAGHKRSEAPTLLVLFQAHAVGVSTLQVCQPPGCILTAASDGKVLLWNSQGERVGDLRHGNRRPNPTTAEPSGPPESSPTPHEAWLFLHVAEQPSARSSTPDHKHLEDTPRSCVDFLESVSIAGPQPSVFPTSQSLSVAQSKAATPKAHVQIAPAQLHAPAPDPFDSDGESDFGEEPEPPALRPKFRAPFPTKVAVACGGLLIPAGAGTLLEQPQWRVSRPQPPKPPSAATAPAEGAKLGGVKPLLRALLGNNDRPTPDDRKQLAAALGGTVVEDGADDAPPKASSRPASPTLLPWHRPASAPFSKWGPSPNRTARHLPSAQRPESAPAIPTMGGRGRQEPLPILCGKSLPMVRK
eukprot:EG_transcript_623